MKLKDKKLKLKIQLLPSQLSLGFLSSGPVGLVDAVDGGR